MQVRHSSGRVLIKAAVEAESPPTRRHASVVRWILVKLVSTGACAGSPRRDGLDASVLDEDAAGHFEPAIGASIGAIENAVRNVTRYSAAWGRDDPTDPHDRRPNPDPQRVDGREGRRHQNEQGGAALVGSAMDSFLMGADQSVTNRLDEPVVKDFTTVTNYQAVIDLYRLVTAMLILTGAENSRTSSAVAGVHHRVDHWYACGSATAASESVAVWRWDGPYSKASARAVSWRWRRRSLKLRGKPA